MIYRVNKTQSIGTTTSHLQIYKHSSFCYHGACIPHCEIFVLPPRSIFFSWNLTCLASHCPYRILNASHQWDPPSTFILAYLLTSSLEMAFPLDTNISLSSISQLVFTKWLSTLSPLLCLLFLAQFIAICLNTSLKQFSPVSSDLPDTKLMDIFPNLLISQIHWSLLTTPPILAKALPPSFNPTARVFSCPFSFSFASFSFP